MKTYMQLREMLLVHWEMVFLAHAHSRENHIWLPIGRSIGTLEPSSRKSLRMNVYQRVIVLLLASIPGCPDPKPAAKWRFAHYPRRFTWPQETQKSPTGCHRCPLFQSRSFPGSGGLWHTPGQPQRVRPSVGTRRSLWNTGPCSPWAPRKNTGTRPSYT